MDIMHQVFFLARVKETRYEPNYVDGPVTNAARSQRSVHVSSSSKHCRRNNNNRRAALCTVLENIW